MRLYKFYSSKWGLNALEKQRLKVTTGADINDPFELSAAELSESGLRKSFMKWRDFMFARHGIISFCRDWRNPVVWSHYAESHRGICLGFDVPNTYVVPVEYVSKRIPFDLASLRSNQPESDKLGARLLRTKFSHWRYENECRIVYGLNDPDLQIENDLYFAPFSKDLSLREVILGPLYTPQGMLPMQDNLEKEGVALRTARAAFKSFDIVTQQKPSLRKAL